MAARKHKVELLGTEALPVIEAKVLILAAITGRFSVRPGEIMHVEAACEKVAEGLIAAGQDRDLVQKLLRDAY
jgi:hypothetical protein